MTDKLLKDCPFCNGKAYIDSECCSDGFGTFFCVKCIECGASSRQHFASQGNDCPLFYQEVRDSWNERVNDDDE